MIVSFGLTQLVEVEFTRKNFFVDQPVTFIEQA
jgi:hypothetical protein